MRLKHLFAALWAAAFLIAGMAARSQSVTVSKIAGVDGKTVVEVNNGSAFVPYLFYAAQVRLDYEYEALGSSWTSANDALYDASFQHGTDAFAGAQGSNNLYFRSVIIPVHWADIQPEAPRSPTSSQTDPSYHWTYLDNLIAKAAAHGVSVQLIWGGSDICGWDYAPTWVHNNHSLFPRVTATRTVKGSPETATALDLSSPALVQYEQDALQATMSEIYHDYAQDPQRRTPVMMVQVENEPDGAGDFAKLITNWSDPVQIKQCMYAGGQFAAVKSLLGTLGSIINRSQYSVVTRCNLGSTYRSAELMNSHACPGCNIFGIDNYNGSIECNAITAGNLDLLSAPFNVAHQPEGPGAYAGVIGLILNNFADGGGFGVYNLRSYSWNGDNAGLFQTVTPSNSPTNTRWDTWTPRNTTVSQDVQALNSLIYDNHVDARLALATRGQAAAFNTWVTDPAVFTPGNTVTDTRQVGPWWIKCTGGYGFAMMDDASHLLLMNVTGGTTFQIGGVPNSPTASIGSYAVGAGGALTWNGAPPAPGDNAHWSGGQYLITLPRNSTVARITLPQAPDAAGTLPGTLAAADYDTGGEHYAYELNGHDTAPASAFRADSSNNLYQPASLNGGWAIGNTYASQWYCYTVDVPATAFYNISFQTQSGPVPGQFSLADSDGTNLTGEVNAPSGNWKNFSTVSANAQGRTMTCFLTGGVHILKLNIDTSPQNYCADIASFTLRLADGGTQSYQIAPANSPQNVLDANGSAVQIVSALTGGGYQTEAPPPPLSTQLWSLQQSASPGLCRLSPLSAAAARPTHWLDVVTSKSGQKVTVDAPASMASSLWSLTPVPPTTAGPGVFSAAVTLSGITRLLDVQNADTWEWSYVGVAANDSGPEQQWLINTLPPPTPTILSAVSSNGTVQVTFDQVAGATAYLLYRAWKAGSEGSTNAVLEFPDGSQKVEPSTQSGSPVRITVTDQAPAGAAFYSVAALGPQGLSAPSAEVTTSH